MEISQEIHPKLHDWFMVEPRWKARHSDSELTSLTTAPQILLHFQVWKYKSDIWRHFLFATTGGRGILLAPNWQRPGTLQDIQQHTEQLLPPHQTHKTRNHLPQMWAVPRVRNSALKKDFHQFSSCHFITVGKTSIYCYFSFLFKKVNFGPTRIEQEGITWKKAIDTPQSRII